MSFKLEAEIVNTRRARVIIKTGEGVEIATLYIHPLMVYRNKQDNYKDLNIPLSMEMLYGTALCSGEVAGMTDLHAVLYDAIKVLLNSVEYKSVMVKTDSKELYDLYEKFIGRLKTEVPAVQFYNSAEYITLSGKWSSDFNEMFRITKDTNVLFAIKKDSTTIYDKTWWNTKQEIMKNEKIA